MSDAITITPPAHALRGRVAPPGSKSITNRALLLAGLAKGASRLTGALKSDDTLYMAQALRDMGVTVEEPDATSFLVASEGRLRAPQKALFLGNAGTATRFLTAAAALADGPVVVDGDEHMRKRPIGPLVSALNRMGIAAEAPTGCPPVRIPAKGGFAAQEMSIDGGLSSQYVSALLMLAACGSQAVRVRLTGLEGGEIGARGYVDLTLAAMRHFGAQAEQEDAAGWIVRPGGYRAADLHIEADASAATYLWAAEALTGGKIDLGTAPEAFTQPDAKAYELIRLFPHLPPEIDGSQMQDAVPTLAALAAFNAAPVRFVGIANLRVKETDRVYAMATELSRLAPGLGLEEGDDLIVTPAALSGARPARIETYADHRIAMSMALTGLRLSGVTILDPGCVGKTYPGYWADLESLGVDLRREA